MADVREELECSICLHIYTDPVTLRCGHNFCRACVERALDAQERRGGYRCPECREKFRERPALRKNTTLSNIAHRFLCAEPKPGDTRILCTNCIHAAVPAARSCLLCECSLCDNHLRVHNAAPEHVLVQPTRSFADRKCPVHKKILEYACAQDAAYICVSCRLDGEHKDHKVSLLKDLADHKKRRLKPVLERLLAQQKQIRSDVQKVTERKRKAEDTAAEETQRVIAVIRDIRRQLEDLEVEVLGEISRQQEQASLSASALLQKLEVEHNELATKVQKVEELLRMDDPFTVLREGKLLSVGLSNEDRNQEVSLKDQEVSLKDQEVSFKDQEVSLNDQEVSFKDQEVSFKGQEVSFKDQEVSFKGQEVSLKDQEVSLKDQEVSFKDLDEGLISRTLSSKLSDFISSVRRRISLPEEMEVLLDATTACEDIDVSGDLRTISRSEVKHYHPQRFQYYPQVVSATRFSSGQHSWDVETSETGTWRIGVCYPSMDRSGDRSYLGENDKSWCLRRYDNSQYSAIHAGKEEVLSAKVSGQRLKICLDYERGEVSFYELGDPVRQLHTVAATFAEPLHAAFCVWDDWVRIEA